LRRVRDVVRTIAPPLGEDRPLSIDIENMARAIREGKFDEWAIPEWLGDPVGVLQ
jgi:histidine ammonia-lyase